jgi:hypothetical protein
LDKLHRKSAKLVVRDHINCRFSKQLFKFKSEQEEKVATLAPEEELPDHLKQELLQDLLDMELNDVGRLFNPFLKLKGQHFDYFIIISRVFLNLNL